MNAEWLFSIAGMLAMAGWVVLLLSPFMPVLSQKIAGLAIPLTLSVGYVLLAIVYFPTAEGGFGTLAQVQELFANQYLLLAGWIHYLAFDLLIGAWICRVAARDGIRYWWLLLCLPLTFLFGPAGFLVFSIVRQGLGRAGSTAATT